MKRIEILLLKDVQKLGKAGDLVRVKWGYAKNYLIPKGWALEANESTIKSHQNMQKTKRLSYELKKKKMERLAQSLSKEKLLFVLKTNEEGKPYGSISATDIAKKLKELGYDIDRSAINIDSIDNFGNFDIPIKLHLEVSCKIKIKIEPER